MSALFKNRGLRVSCKLTIGLVALLALLWVLLLAALRFMIIPNIEGFRPKLTEFLQTSIGRKVEIGALEAGWRGWNPHFTLHELKLIDPQGRVALRLPKVEQEISWRSLPSLTLTSRVLTIEGLRVIVRRDVANRISVAGMEFEEKDPKAEPDSRIADWLLVQRSVNLRNAQVIWQDDFRGAPPLALNNLNARLVNSGNRHRLGVNADWSDELATPIQFLADLNGESAAHLDTWSGQVYARLDSVDIARSKRWVTLPFPVASGVGGLQVWASLDKGLPNDVTADLKLSNVQAKLDGAKAALRLETMQGRLQWSEARGKTQLTNVRAENLQVTLKDKERHSVGPLSFKGLLRRNAQGGFEKSELVVDGFDIESIARLSSGLPIPENFANIVASLSPRGALGRTTLDWEGEPANPSKFNVATSFKNIAIAAVAPYPGVNNVNGDLKLTQDGGQIELSGAGVTLDLPSVFATAPTFDKFRTAAQWIVTPSGIEVKVDQSELANADVSATVSGKWSRTAAGVAAGTTAGSADFAGVINRAKVDRLWAYLPTVIDPKVREYTRHALLAGVISKGEFILRGPLEKFPFPNDTDGQWRITAKADDVTMDYADNWPKVTDADVTFNLSGSRLVADAVNSKIYGLPAKNLRTSIPDLRLASPQLSVIGTVNGPTLEFLKFIDLSPVGDWINHFTRGMDAQGDGQLNLAIEVPLGVTQSKTAVRGEYEFRGNTVKIGGEIPVLSDVRGKLLFTERGTSAKELQAQVMGGPANFVFQNVPGGLKVSATGQADLAVLRTAYKLPHIERASGITDWTMELDTPSGGAFTLKSSLRGAVFDAPAPLGKTASQERALTVVRTPMANGRDELAITIGDRAKARVRIGKRDGARVIEAGALGLGAAKMPELPAAQNVAVHVTDTEVNIDQWLDVVNAFTTPMGATMTAPATATTVASPSNASTALTPSEIFITAERVIAKGIKLNQASIQAKPQGAIWQIDVKSKEADGQVLWSPKVGANGALKARLSKLVLAPRAPVDEKNVAAAVESAPQVLGAPVASTPRDTANWPTLDVVADAFTLRGNAMGKLEIQAAPNAENWRIDRLVVTNADAELKADGLWTRAGATPGTAMNAQLDIADSQKYFSRIGLGEGIKDAKGKVAGKLAWAGSPVDFEMRALNGEFTMELGQGRFTKADPGLAKLLGVISLQSLARRLVFDLRDLFSDGFSFDNASATVQMKSGVLTTNNLDIVGPTARVEIRGTVSLWAETQALDVRVLPDVSTSIAVGAGVATANPLIGAGAFIASKIFKDPLNKAFSVKMKISGTWAEPHMDWQEKGGAREPGATADQGTQ